MNECSFTSNLASDPRRNAGPNSWHSLRGHDMAQKRLTNDSNDSGRMKRETPKIQHGIDGLVAAVRHLEQVKQQARALGMFTDDRELLECPSCGLLEDVTIEGLLVTYPRSSRAMKDCGAALQAGRRDHLSMSVLRRQREGRDSITHRNATEREKALIVRERRARYGV